MAGAYLGRAARRAAATRWPARRRAGARLGPRGADAARRGPPPAGGRRFSWASSNERPRSRPGHKAGTGRFLAERSLQRGLLPPRRPVGGVATLGRLVVPAA